MYWKYITLALVIIFFVLGFSLFYTTVHPTKYNY